MFIGSKPYRFSKTYTVLFGERRQDDAHNDFVVRRLSEPDIGMIRSRYIIIPFLLRNEGYLISKGLKVGKFPTEISICVRARNGSPAVQASVSPESGSPGNSEGLTSKLQHDVLGSNQVCTETKKPTTRNLRERVELHKLLQASTTSARSSVGGVPLAGVSFSGRMRGTND